MADRRSIFDEIGEEIEARAITEAEAEIDAGLGVTVHVGDSALQRVGIDLDLAGKLGDAGSLDQVVVGQVRREIAGSHPHDAEALDILGGDILGERQRRRARWLEFELEPLRRRIALHRHHAGLAALGGGKLPLADHALLQAGGIL